MQNYEAWITELSNVSQEFFAHPFVTIVKFILLVLAVAVFSIRKKIGDNLDGIMGKAFNQCTLIGIRWFSNYSFNLRYKKHIIFEHRVFNVRGLRTQGNFTLEIDKVYVGLKIAPSQNPNKTTCLLNHTVLEGNRPIWAFLQQKLTVLAIIGAPGCGKTTLLQHTALAFAANRHRQFKLTARTPIFLFLREHIDNIISEEIPLAELAHAHFSDEKRYPNLKPTEHWFKNQLTRGKTIVLLDGLDEVADDKHRQKVSTWVDRQIINYPNNVFIVTSRPQGYLAAPLQQAHRLEIQPFNWTQVREFAYCWYRQNEIISSGKKDEGVLNDAKRRADDLLQRLQKISALTDLTVNPLLLTMIAMVHRYRGQLPGRRVELYAEICDVLLGHKRAAIGLQDGLTPAQKRVVLQPLAAEMMLKNQRDITTEAALTIISEPLKQVGINEHGAGESFLNTISSGSGLLNESENHHWSFAHLTFQEYLTSCHWLKYPPEQDWHTLIKQSWWHETIRLYIAQANASSIVNACLSHNSLLSLTLASECEEEALECDVETRQRLQARLAETLETDDTEQFKLAAQVLLNKRLINLQILNDTTQIDAEFISCAEYQLFLDETQNHQQPAHWQTRHFAKGMAKQPVLGVRADDAQAFCAWLSQKTGRDYRLPTTAEARQIPPDKSAHAIATWCWNAGVYELVWLREQDKTHCLQHVMNLHALAQDFSFDGLKLPNYSTKIFRFLYKHLFSYRLAAASLSDENLTLALALDLTLALALDLNLDRALDRALDLDFDLGLDRARDLHAYHYDRDRDRASALTLDRARARALTRALDLDRALDLNRDIDLARVLDIDIDIVLVRDRGPTLALARDRVRARNRARDRGRTLALARGRTRARARDIDLTRALTRALTRDLALTLDLDLDLDLDLALALDLRALALNLDHDFSKYMESYATKTFQTIEQSNRVNDSHSMDLTLLNKNLLSALEAPVLNRASIAQTARKIVLLELETMLCSDWSRFTASLKSNSTHNRWLFWKDHKTYYIELCRKILLAWFVAYKTIEARCENKLPAWEGIRIVHELDTTD
ncbi:MAG: NACHT domain-containing protein [Methylovulum sp.]|nr:NACHT domain-containing protein [Methylovulum sp.]